jgi:hypothetical protein
MRYASFLGMVVLLSASSARAQLGLGDALLHGSPVPALAATPGASVPAEPPQGVHGVLPSYYWQVYGGYTYFRFYEIPTLKPDMHGFNFAVAYYFRPWIAADGEVIAAFGSQSGVNSRFATGMGGVRLRPVSRGDVEFWMHGLAGGAHFLPQTAFGSQNALAYEGGGGVDLNPHHGRLTYRFEGDVLGTHFFGTYQLSPKMSVGLVYKF